LALSEGRGHGLIEDLDATAGPHRHFNPVETGAGFTRTGADGPNLAWRQGIAIDGGVAVELGYGHELLDPIGAEGVTEVGVAELALEAALLLFLDAAA
jgi:hypothetical protein